LPHSTCDDTPQPVPSSTTAEVRMLCDRTLETLLHRVSTPRTLTPAAQVYPTSHPAYHDRAVTTEVVGVL
jgi:hypothetical protein